MPKKFMSKGVMTLIATSAVLAGCATPGMESKADSYSVLDVNQRQEVRTVEILTILPGKVQVSNAENKKAAQMAGAVLGALAGAAVGGSTGPGGWERTGVGTVAGGAAGAVAGSMVSDTVLVDGVQIMYRDGKSAFASAQVGRVCEFKPGPAMMVGSDTTTRIQPNAQCPVADGTKRPEQQVSK
ncbi:hypothetical protein ACFPTO_10250 [Paraburkholderia denitrificans]|uniref:Glycine zipper 2TM domain-containing protein n=1 Tax=Paraburkholderia denitrificans TaxID=694025 RepID=A0ABW0J888_9BURK